MAGSTENYRVFIDNTTAVGQVTIAGIQTSGFIHGVYVSNDVVTNDVSAAAITANSVSASTLSGNLTGNVNASTISTGNFNLNANLTGTFSGNVRATGAVPNSSSSSGTTGDIRVSTGFIYVCVAPNTWARAALSSF